MDQEIKTKIDDFLETVPQNKKYIKYIIDCATEILDDLNENEVKNNLIEDLLNFFDVDENAF